MMLVLKKILKNENKGFTLVELIIVVAVIAILIAVLTPQYTQYVERSRQSHDLQIATSIMDAAVVAIADPKNELPAGIVTTVRWRTKDGGQSIEVDLGSAYKDDLHSNGKTLTVNLTEEIQKIVNISATSKQGALSTAGKSQHFIFRVDANTGGIEVASTNPTPDTNGNGWNSGSGNWVDIIGVKADLGSFYW